MLTRELFPLPDSPKIITLTVLLLGVGVFGKGLEIAMPPASAFVFASLDFIDYQPSRRSHHKSIQPTFVQTSGMRNKQN